MRQTDLFLSVCIRDKLYVSNRDFLPMLASIHVTLLQLKFQDSALNQGEELYKRPAFVLIPRFIVYCIYVCMYVKIYKE